VLLADAGYWRNDAIDEVVNELHIQTLIAPDADKRKGPGRAAAAASTTSRAGSSTATVAPSCTANARAWSTGLRTDQEQPRLPTLLTPRPISRQIRMATTRRYPQPPKTPPTPPPTHLKRPDPGRPAPTGAEITSAQADRTPLPPRHQSRSAVCATPSARSESVVSDDAAKELWPDGWTCPKPYIRLVPRGRWHEQRREVRCRGRPHAAPPRLVC
jgi:hypothetical protein